MFHRFFCCLTAFLMACFLPWPTSARDVEYLSMDVIERNLEQELDSHEEVQARQDEDCQEAVTMLDSMERRLRELHFAVYYQNNANFFYLTYYCAQISDLSMEYATGQQPIVRMRSRLSMSIQRFSHMRQMLEKLRARTAERQSGMFYPPDSSPEEIKHALEQIDRSIERCAKLESNYRRMYDSLEKEDARYEELGTQIHRLDTYANGRFVEQFARQLRDRKEQVVAKARGDKSATEESAQQSSSATTGGNEAEREFAMLETTAKALGVDCDINNSADLNVDKDLETEGRLVSRIALILWDPDSPFRTVQLPHNTWLRRMTALAVSFRTNYLEPANVEMVHHLLAYFGMVFGLIAVALLCVKVHRHGKPFHRNPRHSVFNRAKLCLLLAAASYAFSLWEPLDFLKEGEAFAGGFLMLTSIFYICCAVSINSSMALHAAHALTPLVLVCAGLVTYALVMAPTIMVVETMPLLFVLGTVATAWLLLHQLFRFNGFMRTLCIFTLVLFAVGIVTTMVGYSFLTMMAILSWYIIVLCMLLVAASPHVTRFFIRRLGRVAVLHPHMPLISGWVTLIFRHLLTPYLVIGFLWFGLYWTADGIDLGYIVRSWMGSTSELSDFIRCFSFDRLLFIVCVGIMVHVIVKMVLLGITGGNLPATGVAGSVFEIGRIIVGFVFVVFALSVLDADYNSLLVVMGGLSVGIGLGMKDSLSDFVSGLTLMLGRLRPGDVITCDDFLGCVSSIGLRATWVEAYDGTSVCFQNSTLLSKNFRNLTRKHSFVRKKVEVGVAYGTDTKKARAVALKAVSKLRVLSPHHETLVWVDELDSSSVNLSVVVWVPASYIPQSLSLVRETVYAAFRQNGIAIPFPQCDVHLTTNDQG